MISTTRCCSTGSRPSASRASPSMSPIAISAPDAARLHCRRRAGPRAIYPQHGDRRVECRAAVLLVDARHGLTVRRMRHSRIAALLGIRHVLVGQQDGPGRFRRAGIRRDSRRVSDVRRAARFRSRRCDPGCGALRRQRHEPQRADAVVSRIRPCSSISRRSKLPAAASAAAAVPGAVGRPAPNDFRGYAGKVGERHGRATAMPSWSRARGRPRTSTASSPSTAISTAPTTGQAVTLVLADHVDVARGDCDRTRRCAAGSRRPIRRASGVARRRAAAAGTNLLSADWNRKRSPATVTALKYKIDVQTRRQWRPAARSMSTKSASATWRRPPRSRSIPITTIARPAPSS